MDLSEIDNYPDLPDEAILKDHHPLEIDEKWLKQASPDLQISAMNAWFRARFQDPANDTPYNGREGGYLFIHGGPHDPDEEIQGRFSHIVEFDTMKELINDLLVLVGDEWAPIDRAEDYDDYLRLILEERETPEKYFRARINDIDNILKLQGDENIRSLLRQMVFSSIIAAVEAYIAETVSYWVEHNEQIMRNFVSSAKEFRERKIRLSDTLMHAENMQATVQTYIAKQVWHRADSIQHAFIKGFQICIPDIKPLMQEIQKRHDIIHRAGKTKGGKAVNIGEQDIRHLRRISVEFVDSIEAELEKLSPSSTEF